jgi:hypothetical protein
VTANTLLPLGYLSTSGNQIVDSNGNDVRIASVGWNQNFSDIPGSVAQMAASGFNTIRVSWADATLSTDLPRIQQIVAAATANGMKVILDHHTDEAGTAADGYGSQQKNGLWYDVGPGTDGTNGAGVAGTVSAAQFQADWVQVAQTFAGNSTVAGFDLDNEPLEYGVGATPANWGGGGPTDIHAMYQTVGDAIQAVDPGALIIAEGPISLSLNNFDLTQAATDPVVLNVANKVVYSAHIYPSAIGGQPVDSGAALVANLNQSFGYLEAQNVAPVWIGEMGASLDGTADSAGAGLADEQAWAQTMVAYLNGLDGALGGPTFSGSQQGMSTDWWDWGYNAGQYPDGTLNGDGSLNSAQEAIWSQLQPTTTTPTPTATPARTPTPATPTPTPSPVATPPTGSTDPAPASTTSTITLDVSEDAYQGDAQFTVQVDGTQVGGVMTASALHGISDSNVFTLTGNWSSAAAHQVQIQFINDAYGGTPTTDRNLYVDSAAFNGAAASGSAATLYNDTTAGFTVGGTTPVASAPADTLTVQLAEDAWNGNAQFSLSIDGKQITTPQDVVASHADATWETFDFAGNLGAGPHTIGISFSNDAYGGTTSTDRNLYVGGLDINGQNYGSGVTALMANGTATFNVTTTQ